MIVSRKEFADLAGVSRQAISSAAKDGGVLFTACSGKGIDIKQSAARAYLEKKGLDPDQVIKKLETEKNEWRPPSEAKAIDPNKIQNMTLREIDDTFGNVPKMRELLSARKILTEIEKIEIDNAQKAGTLVSRDLVHKGIIDPIDSAFRRLVTDVPKTAAVRAVALLEAGKTVLDVEEMLKDQVAAVIRPVKSRVKREFKNV